MRGPVLFLVFNRPEVTRRVFEAIREQKPPRLYVAADGFRENHLDEKRVVDEVRGIATNVDWPCEVKTLFREKNIGCKLAIAGAIDWFFEHEEQGIILEDDCLPSPSFFGFCEDMLDKYKDDKQVMQISSFNPFEEVEIDEDYYFSKYGTIWGWATWRNRWAGVYDIDLCGWAEVKKNGAYKEFCDSKREEYWRELLFDDVVNKVYDVWAYQWVYARLMNGGLCVTYKKNLLDNIGFGEIATLTTGSFNVKKFEVSPNIKHPAKIVRNMEIYKAYFTKFIDQGFNKLRIP